MALILERRASKDEILELYLNEVYLGQRGSFAIHGVAEAARLFFGKDVGNLTLAESATVAGMIQSPPALSPFNAPQRARDRRARVLQAMVDADYISPDAATRASHEPMMVVARALDAGPTLCRCRGRNAGRALRRADGRHPGARRTRHSISICSG